MINELLVYFFRIHSLKPVNQLYLPPKNPTIMKEFISICQYIGISLYIGGFILMAIVGLIMLARLAMKNDSVRLSDEQSLELEDAHAAYLKQQEAPELDPFTLTV